MSETPLHRLSDLAQTEAARRGISLDDIDAVMRSSGQIVTAYGGRSTYQSKLEIDDKLYVLRAIVEGSDPITVVTVYLASKVEKYWSDDDESNL